MPNSWLGILQDYKYYKYNHSYTANLTNPPPHIASLLPIIVEQLVPGPVGQVEGVAPQQEHEDDDQDVLG